MHREKKNHPKKPHDRSLPFKDSGHDFHQFWNHAALPKSLWPASISSKCPTGLSSRAKIGHEFRSTYKARARVGSACITSPPVQAKGDNCLQGGQTTRAEACPRSVSSGRPSAVRRVPWSYGNCQNRTWSFCCHARGRYGSELATWQIGSWHNVFIASCTLVLSLYLMVGELQGKQQKSTQCRLRKDRNEERKKGQKTPATIIARFKEQTLFLVYISRRKKPPSTTSFVESELTTTMSNWVQRQLQLLSLSFILHKIEGKKHYFPFIHQHSSTNWNCQNTPRKRKFVLSRVDVSSETP